MLIIDVDLVIILYLSVDHYILFRGWHYTFGGVVPHFRLVRDTGRELSAFGVIAAIYIFTAAQRLHAGSYASAVLIS